RENRAGTTCVRRRVVASTLLSQLQDAPPSSTRTKAASSAASVLCGSSISDLKPCAPEGRIAAWVFSLPIFFGLRNHAGRRSEPISNAGDRQVDSSDQERRKRQLINIAWFWWTLFGDGW